jgi:hypothetical protein
MTVRLLLSQLPGRRVNKARLAPLEHKAFKVFRESRATPETQAHRGYKVCKVKPALKVFRAFRVRQG